MPLVKNMLIEGNNPFPKGKNYLILVVADFPEAHHKRKSICYFRSHLLWLSVRECEAVVTLVPRRGQRKTDEGNISVTAASYTVRMILMILEVRPEILCKQSFKIIHGWQWMKSPIFYFKLDIFNALCNAIVWGAIVKHNAYWLQNLYWYWNRSIYLLKVWCKI